MVRLLILLSCLFSVTTYAASWSPAAPITNSSPAYKEVSVSSIPTTGQFIATWTATNDSNYPTYSIYTPGSGWSNPARISNSPSSIVLYNVLTSVNPTTGVVLAAWGDMTDSNPPIYSFYTPSSGWGAIGTIPGISGDYDADVSLSFIPTTGGFIATWTDNNTFFPYFSIYTPGMGWSTSAQISGTFTNYFNVFTSVNPATGTILATWGDGNPPYYPTYSFYNGSTWSAPLPITTSSTVRFYDVNSSFNSVTGQFLAMWGDDSTGLPTYSFYTAGSGWSPIATLSDSSGVAGDIINSVDPLTGQILATWSDYNNHNYPTYALYTPGSGWSSVATISTSFPAYSDVITSFDPITSQFFGTWADTNNNNYPTYSSLFLPFPPPSGLKGVQKKNNFAIVSELFNSLTWQNDPGATSYQIYRNGILIATLDGNATSYEDHDQPRKKQTYSVIAVHASGASTAATVVVGGK